MPLPVKIVKNCRELRKNQTPAETEFWERTRNRKIAYKVVRQYPILYGYDHEGEALYYIADFYIASKKLIIEIDGEIHKENQEYDIERTFILTSKGYKVIRFSNEEILNNFSSVLERILNF